MNLIPQSTGITPNYWCTWGVQNYSLTATMLGTDDPAVFEGDSSFKLAMNNLNERVLFESPGWLTNAYSDARRDLFVLFDNGWDLPPDMPHPGHQFRFGSIEVDASRFPSLRGTPAERLTGLNERVQAAGWRGVGLWIAPQVPRLRADDPQPPEAEAEAYWRERARWSRQAGIHYWKVDIGALSESQAYRAMMSRIVAEEAPGLIVEHAPMGGPLNDIPSIWEHFPSRREWRYRAYGNGAILQRTLGLLPVSDVVRLYDVTAPFSVVSMLDRVVEALLQAPADSRAILNCEDEPYMAAVLGCAFGLMRHPMWQERPGMDYDPARYREQLDAATRAARWQRIAPAWRAGQGKVNVSEEVLSDTWHFKPGDTWASWVLNQDVVQRAPAIVTRNLDLPIVQPAVDGAPVPFVVTSRHPNGLVAVGTLPRALEDQIGTPHAHVTLTLPSADQPIGVFGSYASLRLRFPEPIAGRQIWAQDLASDQAEEITAGAVVDGDMLRLDGALLESVGLRAAHAGDRSEPGLVLRLE